MSIKIAYRDGVFEPLETVEGAQPGAIYTAFSEDELRDFLETLGWLVSFPFTDLTSSKRRPALVISPDVFNERGEDHDRMVAIGPGDLLEGTLPKPSYVKVAKAASFREPA